MKKGCWVLLLFMITGCVSNDLPENVLSYDKMANLMLDIYESEAKLNHNKTAVKVKDLFGPYMEMVYERNGVTDSTYKANLAYYIDHPVHFEKVYEIMVDSITLRQQSLPGGAATVDDIPGLN